MIYEYKCPNSHGAEKLRKIANRNDPLSCPECGEPMFLIISRTHRQPDGIYSFAPNVGSPDAFDRRWENMKAGKRIMDKE